MIYFILGYIIFLIAFGIFSFIALYHVRRYGYREGASSTMMVTYTVIAVLIVVVTIVLLTFSGFSIPNNFHLGF